MKQRKKGYKFIETENEKPATDKQKYYIEVNNLGNSNVSLRNAIAIIGDHKKKLHEEKRKIEFRKKSEYKEYKRDLKEKRYDALLDDKYLKDIKAPKASKQLKDYAKSKGLSFDEDITTQDLRDMIDELGDKYG